MIPERGEQWIAEAAYRCLRAESGSRERMAEYISELLDLKNASPLLKSVAIRMAQIFSAEEGHS